MIEIFSRVIFRKELEEIVTAEIAQTTSEKFQDSAEVFVTLKFIGC